MIKLLGCTVSCFAGSVLCASVVAARPYVDWRLVADSSCIVECQLAVVDRLPAGSSRQDEIHLNLEIHQARLIKGSVAEGSVVRVDEYGVKAREIKEKLKRQLADEVILFAYVDRSGSDEELRLTWPYSLAPHVIRESNPELVRAIAAEVRRQKELVEKFPSDWKERMPDRYSFLKRTVDDLTIAGTAESALEKIRRVEDGDLGILISLMDDFRKIALKEVAIEDGGPGAWEGILHFGPEKVVDLISIFLHGLTNGDGGMTTRLRNGASDEERRRTIDAWKLYWVRTRGSLTQ